MGAICIVTFHFIRLDMFGISWVWVGNRSHGYGQPQCGSTEQSQFCTDIGNQIPQNQDMAINATALQMHHNFRKNISVAMKKMPKS